MRRIDLPPVVGELLAGVLLGPSLFGLILPDLQAHIFPKSQTQSDLLSVVSWLGVLFLLVVTGIETDLNLIVRKGRTALLISLGGIVVPFATGLGLGWLLPENFLADPAQRLVFCLFIATAMSISAVPVIAKVLMDLKLIRRDIGQVTLAAGMTDDTIGWILLSVVSGLATSGQFNFSTVISAVSGAVIFLGVALTIGRTAVDRILRWVDDTIGGATAALSIVLILALSAAALTHSLGIEAALGAFVLGILAGQSRRFSREAGHTLEVITAGFLAPIFFAAAGLKVNLLQLLQPETFIIGMIVLAVACFGKFVGAYLGSRLGGLGHWEAMAMGSGMNARGAMEIIVATIGLSLGVLSQQMYSIIVMVAIVTSLMAPPLLRWTLSKVAIGEEEAQRLQQEEHASRSFIKNIRRVLIPTRGGANVQLAAQYSKNAVEVASTIAAQTGAVVTLIHVINLSQTGYAIHDYQSIVPAREMAQQIVEHQTEIGRLLGATIQSKILEGNSPEKMILNFAQQERVDLVVLGSSVRLATGRVFFGHRVDAILNRAKCPVALISTT